MQNAIKESNAPVTFDFIRAEPDKLSEISNFSLQLAKEVSWVLSNIVLV